MVVAEDGGEVVGFVHVILHEDPTWGALLDNLHVRHDRARQGIGTALVGEVARAADGPLYMSPRARGRNPRLPSVGAGAEHASAGVLHGAWWAVRGASARLAAGRRSQPDRRLTHDAALLLGGWARRRPRPHGV
ncbi:MAG TPA: GNAT family N-acetyltransferase [Bacillota bacterium]|nr:GNAT family N-acetyltransferase [Bacillota bacterium]